MAGIVANQVVIEAVMKGALMSDYYDLGTYSRLVTTHSTEAQVWFDRGLLWCYSYNHEEAVRCFRKAAENDKACAMAYWGIAYASGTSSRRASQARNARSGWGDISIV